MSAPFLAGLVGMSVPSLAMTMEYGRRPDMTIAISTSVLWIATLAYLTMTLGLLPPTLVRHLDWLFTTPLLLADLGIASGAPKHEIVLAVVADVLMVSAGYLATLSSAHKTVFWSAGMAFFMPVVWLLWRWHGRASEGKKRAIELSALAWFVYPFVFFMDDSHPTTQWVYAAVDVIAKAGVGALIVWR